MKNCYILLVCFFIIITAKSQSPDSSRYLISYKGTGAINITDENKSYLLSNAIRFGISKPKIKLNAGAGWIYGSQNKILTNNDFNSDLTLNLLPYDSSRLYYWGLTAFDKSYSLKINSRFQAGAGAAYTVLQQKNNYINISDGILYENSDLYLTDTLRDVYGTVRNSFRLSYKLLVGKIVSLDGQHFLQNSLLLSEDYIIRSSSTLSLKLNNWLSLTGSLLYNKVNRTKRENLLMTYGLTIEKRF